MFKLFGRFLEYFGKRYEVKLVYMFIMAFLSSFLEFISIVLVFPFIMIMVNPSKVINNPIAIYIQDHFGIQGANNIIIFIGGLIASIIILKNIYSILITYWQNKLINKWGLEIKEKMLNLMLYSPYEADLIKGDAEKINKITENIDNIMQKYVFKLICFISNSILIVLIFSILIYLLPIFTILAILFFTATGIAQSEGFRKWAERVSIKKHQLTQGPYDEVMNSFRYTKDIKVNNCQNFFLNFFSNISNKIIPYDEKTTLIPLIPQYILEIIFILTMIILCIGIFIKYGQNPSNILITFGVVAITIYRVVPQIYKNQVYLNYINLHKKYTEELLNTYAEYQKYEYPKNKDSKERLAFNEKISIQNLSYSYDKKTNVLTGINLDIKKGEFIGIVGLSGAGKSTLVDCLLGLLEYNGSIYVDEEILTTENITNFRNIIGYVPQKVNTIVGDIYTNVAWGVERKDIDKEKVDAVLVQAQLYEQLRQTENGLGLELKKDGTGLSGGQMQRIGIARALYRDPEIIVLDEATSNLDVKIENKLTEIISEIKGSKTIIAIAHRLSTLVNCDKIVYLKDGELVDVGSFQKLSAKHPDFEEIVKLSRIKLEDE